MNDAILVVPTTVCDATPGWVGVPKGVPCATVSYRVLLLVPPQRPLYTQPHRDSMKLWSSFIYFCGPERLE